MVFKKFNLANNAKCQLDSPIDNNDLVFIAKWNYNLFPTANFVIRITHFDTDGVVLGRENMLIDTRVSDTFTINASGRAYEEVPLDDTATTQTQQALPFYEDDLIECVLSKSVIKDIQDEIDLKASQASVDALNNTYAAASGGTDTYAFTIPGFVSYAANVGKTYKFLADVDNTGASGVNISGVGVVPMYKGFDNDTVSWDIKANQIITIVIGLGGTSVQMTSQVDTIIDLSAATPPALYDATFPAWEDLTAWNAVFLEPSATFAQATSVRNIGDVTGNTRVSLPCFWAWVSASTLKLALKKFVSPSVSLGIRIETDDGSGNPSGTLAHANATATVTAWSLTTSLADTTITFAGAFTLTAWIKYHIVCFQGTYGTETINGTNYYWIGYYTNNSTTRQLKMWDGSSWSYAYSSVGSTDITLAWSSQQNNGTSNTLWLQYLAVKDVFITTITKNVNCTATKAYIKSDGGTLLDTMTFSGNVATPTTAIKFTAWTYFRIEVDNNGASYTNRREQSPTTYPQTWTDLAITSNSLSGANNPVGNQNNSVLTVNTGVATLVNTFPYSSSSLFYDAVLSKTSATYSYKIDWHGICSETKTVWQFPKITVCGIDSNQSGMTLGATQYLSNTAWVIAWSAWANSKKIGKATGETKIKIIDIPL